MNLLNPTLGETTGRSGRGGRRRGGRAGRSQAGWQADSMLGLQNHSLYPLVKNLSNLQSETQTYQGQVERGGAQQSSGRGWSGRDADRIVRPGNNRPSFLPWHPKQIKCLECFPQNVQKTNYNN